MMRFIAAFLFAVFVSAVHAQAPALQGVSTPLPSVVSGQETAIATAEGANKFDAAAATRVFMNRLQGEARAKSDAYAEGGYWLLLWNLLYGLLVAWLLLSLRISVRIRDFVEQRSRHKNLQSLLYTLVYVPLTALLSLPITYYEGFYRDARHQNRHQNSGN